MKGENVDEDELVEDVEADYLEQDNNIKVISPRSVISVIIRFMGKNIKLVRVGKEGVWETISFLTLPLISI